MALDHLDVVRSLTLVSSWAGPDPYFDREFTVRRRVLTELGSAAYSEVTALFLFAPSVTASRPEVVEAWMTKASAGRSDPEVMASRIDMIMKHDQRDRLPQVTVPTLVLVGDEDICTPPHQSRELARLIPGATLNVLTGGHLIYLERSDEFHRTVAGFLREH
jgi:aminoacrylate hydrolase